jgi:hypothetical protein
MPGGSGNTLVQDNSFAEDACFGSNINISDTDKFLLTVFRKMLISGSTHSFYIQFWSGINGTGTELASQGKLASSVDPNWAIDTATITPPAGANSMRVTPNGAGSTTGLWLVGEVSVREVNEVIATKNYTNDDLCGLDIQTLATGLSGRCTSIEFIFSGYTALNMIGYLWAGSMVEADHEQIQLSDNSTDLTNITIGNFAATTPRNSMQSAQVTLAKDAFDDVQTFCRALLRSGLGTPRPVVLNECDQIESAFLGISDANKFQYDIFRRKSRMGQATIGFSEVFGRV